MICVGNLTAGGAGKTPTVIALVERLRARGRRGACRLARPRRQPRGPGAGRASGGTARPRSATSRCCSPPSRRSGSGATAPPPARAAEAAGAARGGDGRRACRTPRSPRISSIVVVDAGFGFGNGRVMPAGPLREPVARRPRPRRPRARDRRRRRRGPASAPPGRRPRRCRSARRRRSSRCRPAWTGAACAPSPSPASAGRRSSSPPCAPLGAELVAARELRATMRPTTARLLARLDAEARGRGRAARHHREGRRPPAGGVPRPGAGAAGPPRDRRLGAARRGAGAARPRRRG